MNRFRRAVAALLGPLCGMACGAGGTKTAPVATAAREAGAAPIPPDGPINVAPPASEADAAPDGPSSAVGPQPLTVATGPQGAEEIVVDAHNVYWLANQVSAEQAGVTLAEIMQCAKSGCSSPNTLANDDEAEAIAVDDTYVYWTRHDGIMRVPIGGGTPASFTSTWAGSIAIDATDVYWTSQDAVLKEPRAGGSPTTIAMASARGNIAVDGANVYWADMGGTISKAPKDGGTATVLATGQSPGTLALDATNVYWTNDDQSGGTVKSVRIAGGTPTVLASNLRFLNGITVSPSTVYWTSDYAVKKLPVGGGVATTVFPLAGFADPMAITLDATNIYWTDYVTGNVLQLPQD